MAPLNGFSKKIQGTSSVTGGGGGGGVFSFKFGHIIGCNFNFALGAQDGKNMIFNSDNYLYVYLLWFKVGLFYLHLQTW